MVEKNPKSDFSKNASTFNLLLTKINTLDSCPQF